MPSLAPVYEKDIKETQNKPMYLKYKSPKLIELNPEFYPEESPEDQSRNRKIKIKRFVKAANINTNTIKPPKK